MFQKKAQPNRPPTEVPMSNPEPRAPSASSSPNETAGGAATVLAEGARFVGKAKVSGTFRVEGNAEGEIEAAEALVVGSTGHVQAQAQARRAVVNGHFKGKIAVREGVEFQAGSKVEADVKAKNMVMEDGVRFRGNCEIGG